jgi:RNA polymerase sigma-70 factor (ECF subfamily)
VVDPNEKKLLVLLKNDDKSALKILFEKYHPGLCAVAYRLTKDHDVSKDIVQDVFVKIWINRKTLEITTSLPAYLKRSVINTSLNHLEKEQRYPTIEIDRLVHHPSASPIDRDHAFDEISSALENAIDRLPVRTRAVFLLIRKEEMSYKEVAESLNISLKAVEKEMMKALKLLREKLKNFLPAVLAMACFI